MNKQKPFPERSGKSGEIINETSTENLATLCVQILLRRIMFRERLPGFLARNFNFL